MTAIATLAAVLGMQASLGAGPAAAHASLVGTDPAEGARVSEAPRTVVLTFSEEVDPGFVTVNLRVDGGRPERLEADTTGTDVTASVGRRPAGAGAAPTPWQVDYRVVSVDGHPITGSLRFDVAASPDASASPSASAEPQSPTPSADPQAGDETEVSPAPASEQTSDDGRAWLPTVTVGILTAAVVAGLVAWLARGRRAGG